MIGQSSLCMSCKHFNRANKNRFTCTAFPDEIPDVISKGIYIHRMEFPGDNGIMYEPIKETTKTGGKT